MIMFLEKVSNQNNSLSQFNTKYDYNKQELKSVAQNLNEIAALSTNTNSIVYQVQIRRLDLGWDNVPYQRGAAFYH